MQPGRDLSTSPRLREGSVRFVLEEAQGDFRKLADDHDAGANRENLQPQV